jgi:serine/threonine protein kinase
MNNDDIQLIRLIDDGNFGEVWKARQKSLNRIVAVKVIKADKAIIASAIQHAQALAQCQHKNVITVHFVTKVMIPDSGKRVDGVVMEFLDGVRLDNRLRNPPHLQMSEVIKFVDGILSGLQHIHERGVAHGDLGCKNIMIADGDVKLIDIDYSNLDSVLKLSSTTTTDLQIDDIADLKTAIRRIVKHSEIDSDVAEELPGVLACAAGLNDVRATLSRIFAGLPNDLAEFPNSAVVQAVENVSDKDAAVLQAILERVSQFDSQKQIQPFEPTKTIGRNDFETAEFELTIDKLMRSYKFATDMLISRMPNQAKIHIDIAFKLLEAPGPTMVTRDMQRELRKWYTRFIDLRAQILQGQAPPL